LLYVVGHGVQLLQLCGERVLLSHGGVEAVNLVPDEVAGEDDAVEGGPDAVDVELDAVDVELDAVDGELDAAEDGPDAVKGELDVFGMPTV
jgi:hypothetical protein